MTSISFFVPVPPRPKERPRTVRVQQGRRVITYTPRATKSYEHTVKAYALQAARRAGWSCTGDDRFALTVTLHLEGDRSRADLDNLVKSVADGLVPEIIPDDSLICRLVVARVMRSTKPGAQVSLEKVEEIYAAEEGPRTRRRA